MITELSASSPDRFGGGATVAISAVAAGLVLAAGAAGIALGGVLPRGDGRTFDHEEHAGLFPSCLACHRGVVEAGARVFPDVASCASCHDGTDSLQVVEWEPPAEPASSNLRFTHDAHAVAVAAEAEPEVACGACHAPEAVPWMTIERAVVASCVDCHDLPGEHLVLAAACATCHTDLADSPTLRTEHIAAFPAPPSHDAPEFPFEHRSALGPSCGVCHAREFCVQCHVDAPEQPTIVDLPMDQRSLALAASLPEPAGHDEPGFLADHGRTASAAPGTCATCHTAGSCTTCHVGSPQLAAALPSAGPGRAIGARTLRTRPPSHDVAFLTSHGSDAAARPGTCAGCHVRSDCTRCHRPGAAAGGGFHPSDFLARHPAAAYARETTCASCHSTAEFCSSCHASAGLTAGDVLASSFHDGQVGFSVGHGLAARQSLETCASCHVERDCMACHSATGGRGIDPHGPDFDAERLRRTNPQMCTACHGSEIPPPS